MTVQEMIEVKEKRGYSIARLSEYSGVPVGTIQKIFQGITKKPRQATLDALEKVLRGEEAVYSGKAFQYENTLGAGHPEMVKEATAAYGASAISKASAKKQGEYTLADYYAIPDERRVELIDGVIYDMTAPKPVHQAVVGFFHITIANYIRSQKGKCRVWLSPFDVQLDCDDRTMLEPDLVILCDGSKMRGFGLYGAPDFVLEVLSNSTRRKDMFLKAGKYENAGVREYWIVDPVNKKLIIYNYMDPNLVPQVFPLQGQKGLAIYDDRLQIDLDALSQEIDQVNGMGE